MAEQESIGTLLLSLGLMLLAFFFFFYGIPTVQGFFSAF